MDNEEIKEEIDETTEEDEVEIEEASEETEDEGAEALDIDEEFEYDEEGNIVIPEEDDENDVTEEEQGESEDGGEGATETKAAEVTEPAKNDVKDEEIARLRRELEAFRSQAKDTLKHLGVEGDDVEAGLVKLAAEAAETTPEEYLKKREEDRRAEEARKTVQRIAFEKKMQDDLAAIHSAYPETRKYASVMEFPNFKRFAELRDSGNTPTEAFDAAHPQAIRESAANATRQQSLNNTKNHLKSAVPKGSKDNSVTMTKKDLLECREIFPDLSDKEILALYRKTK